MEDAAASLRCFEVKAGRLRHRALIYDCIGQYDYRDRLLEKRLNSVESESGNAARLFLVEFESESANALKCAMQLRYSRSSLPMY